MTNYVLEPVPKPVYRTVLDLRRIPPERPADRDTYVIGRNAIGAWADYDNHLTQWDGNLGAWVVEAPQESMCVLLQSTWEMIAYDGTEWVFIDFHGYDDELIIDAFYRKHCRDRPPGVQLLLTSTGFLVSEGPTTDAR